MNKIDISDRFASMWRKSREQSGKSQEYVAKALGVSKKTIQNWEDGLSSPSQAKGFEWFQVLGVQPLPYYLDMLYGEITPDMDDKIIEDALITYVKACTTTEKRKWLYIIRGKHGSSAQGVLEMITAHLHVPLKDRLNVAHNIIDNYEIAQAHGTLINNANVSPDMELLNRSYENAKKSVKSSKNEYTNM